MRYTLLTCLLLSLVLAVSAPAAFRLVMDYQGQLTDPGGNPVTDGDYSLTFTIYDDSSAGNALWSSGPRQVSVSGGLFSHLLGDSVSLSHSMFATDASLWLGVQVGADPEMAPRTQLAAASRAAVAAGVNGDIRTSPGAIVVDDDRMGGPIDSTVIVTNEASTLDHRGHVTILKISNGGTDTTDLVGMYGDPDVPNITLGDDDDPDSGVVVTSAVDHKHRGHVTILKIAGGGTDTTNMIGIYGDPDVPNITLGDDDDPDSGVVVTSAVDHKHRGHVTILKIAGGGTDTTDMIGIYGDPDVPNITLGDDDDPDSGVVVTSAVDHKHRGHVTILKIAGGGTDTTDLVGLYGNTDVPSVQVGDGDDPDSSMVVRSSVDHKHRGHVTILKISDGGADTSTSIDMYGADDTASIQLYGGGGSGGRIALLANGSSGSGQIGVNTATPAYELDVVGTMCASGGMCQQSDARLKKNIRPLSDAMNLVQALAPVRYEWRSDEYPERQMPDESQIGFIAQEVEKILPEVVSQGSDGIYALDYAKLTPVLVGALQEQQATINELQEAVQKLTGMVNNLLASQKTDPPVTLVGSVSGEN